MPPSLSSSSVLFATNWSSSFESDLFPLELIVEESEIDPFKKDPVLSVNPTDDVSDVSSCDEEESVAISVATDDSSIVPVEEAVVVSKVVVFPKVVPLVEPADAKVVMNSGAGVGRELG
jgi:hypothetical protein